MKEFKDLTKEEVITLVSSEGELKFLEWYKGELRYKNNQYTVVIKPDYRSSCCRTEALQDLLLCEDYAHVYVFEGTKKPFRNVWYKEGDSI